MVDFAHHHRPGFAAGAGPASWRSQDLPLQQGDPFNRFAMQASADTITRRLRDRGYPSATRLHRLRESNKASQDRLGHPRSRTRRARGDRPDPGQSERSGSTPRWCASCLVARPGRRYSQDELFQSQRNLYESDLFRFASVNIDSAAYQPERRFGAAAGAGQRGQAAPDPRRPRLCHQRLLPRLAGLDLAQLSWRRAHSGSHQPGLQGRRGDPGRLGAGRQHLSAPPRNDTRRLGQGELLSRRLGAAAGLSLAEQRGHRLGLHRAALRVQGLPPPGDRRQLALTRTTPRRRNPLSLTYTLSYGRTEATAAELLLLLQRLHQRRHRAAAGEPGAGHAHGRWEPFPGSTARSIPPADRIDSLELTYSSKYIGSSSLQQFTRFVAGMAWYRPLSRDVVLELAGARGRDRLADVDVATRSRRLHSAGAAVLCRRAQRRARLRAQRARPGGLRRTQERGRLGRHTINRGLGAGGGHRRQYARRRPMSSCGCRRRSSAPGCGWPPSSMPGSLAAAGQRARRPSSG